MLQNQRHGQRAAGEHLEIDIIGANHMYTSPGSYRNTKIPRRWHDISAGRSWGGLPPTMG
jgi:hypothetical protein